MIEPSARLVTGAASLSKPSVRSAMMIKVRVISDSKELRDIRDLWDRFVDMQADDPNLLSAFVERSIELGRSDGWTPLLLMILADEVIVGLAPLLTKRKFGIRYARFVTSTYFVASEGYREICVSRTLDYLFRALRCHFVRLTLPATSCYTTVLKHECHEKRIHLAQDEGTGQSIIAVKGTWDEFTRSRGKKFLQDIRRTERNLGRMGLWRCLRVEGTDRSEGVFEQMTRIDSKSWKQRLRNRTGQALDEGLLSFWDGSRRAARTVANFRWHVWFLEVGGQMVAFTLVLTYKGVAVVAKTSFDQEFARFGPGIYLMNVAIRGLFEERRVHKIDFISDVPFTRTWTSTGLRRIGFTMTSRTGISRIVMSLFRGNAFGRAFRRRVLTLTFLFPRAVDVFPFLDLL
jgi:CelD/BcsL family acetyltransferase involved in cellulose biosynthesis